MQPAWQKWSIGMIAVLTLLLGWGTVGWASQVPPRPSARNKMIREQVRQARLKAREQAKKNLARVQTGHARVRADRRNVFRLRATGARSEVLRLAIQHLRQDQKEWHAAQKVLSTAQAARR